MHSRNELIGDCWKSLDVIARSTPESLNRDQQNLLMEYAQPWVSGVVVSTDLIVNKSILLAIVRIRSENEDPWVTIRHGLARLYWMNEISIHQFKSDAAEYDAGDSRIYARCFFHSMMLQAGATDIADWVAPFMLNVFRKGGWFDADKEFGRFYTLLLEAQLRGSWIPSAELNHGLAPEVADLLRSLSDPDLLQAALIKYCDWRLARANKYPNFSASRKKGEYVFANSWWRVFPFELFAVQGVYERCSGMQISLQAAHPLLEGALMCPPALYPLPETKETAQLREFINKVYGAEWQPLASVPLLD